MLAHTAAGADAAAVFAAVRRTVYSAPLLREIYGDPAFVDAAQPLCEENTVYAMVRARTTPPVVPATQDAETQTAADTPGAFIDSIAARLREDRAGAAATEAAKSIAWSDNPFVS